MSEPSAPETSLPKLFLRFLRFGALAWGGPVAQIAMVRDELVERDRWVPRERFNRVLAVYQALPGPEAHELCVYFGYTAAGRWGGFLAGLGFMLPGLVLCILVAWLYVEFGATTDALTGLFFGLQAAVAALIVRAVVRIGRHALGDAWLWAIGALSALAFAVDVPFFVILVWAGSVYALIRRARPAAAIVVSLLFVAAAIALADPSTGALAQDVPDVATGDPPSLISLLVTGLRAGLLTFGGAYTAIPFVQHDAVVAGRWMTNAHFLDALALSGILPAPFVIFVTFVGFVGGGLDGALVVTLGVFLPAFAFTLIGFRQVERVVENRAAHAFLDGVTAGVVGLIAVTGARLLPEAIPDVWAAIIFVAALVALWRWKAKMAILGVVVAAGGLGVLVERL